MRFFRVVTNLERLGMGNEHSKVVEVYFQKVQTIQRVNFGNPNVFAKIHVGTVLTRSGRKRRTDCACQHRDKEHLLTSDSRLPVRLFLFNLPITTLIDHSKLVPETQTIDVKQNKK